MDVSEKDIADIKAALGRISGMLMVGLVLLVVLAWGTLR